MRQALALSVVLVGSHVAVAQPVLFATDVYNAITENAGDDTEVLTPEELLDQGGDDFIIEDTAGANTFNGGDGADDMSAWFHEDTVGTNWFYGGDGDDRIRGGNQPDYIYGGYGSDDLQGVGGDDWLYHCDESKGENTDGGLDWLRGGAGNDTGYLNASDGDTNPLSDIENVNP